MPVRRSLKNVVHNYTEPQVKVREATSNDPWGPSSSLMTEIADLTYHVVAFSEIMSMIWKRLNDHGKNWRHVYKSLVLLDYIIKTGSERVAQQCKENIFAIQTLKDFQFIDRDGKDQGVNVREKSKQLVALLKDDERLKQERQRALKAKERFAQANTGIGSSSPQLFSETQEGKGASSSPYRADDTNFGDVGPASEATAGTPPGISSDIEQARPQTHGEEELQLQLALAMSKEEADQVSKEMAQVKSQPAAASGPPAPATAASQPPAEEDDIQLRYVLAMSKGEAEKEERMRRGDDVRLQMALEESQKENSKEELNQSSLLDLADTTPPGPAADPWGAPAPANNSAPQPIRQADPWGGGGATISAPASATNMSSLAQADPWGSSSPPAQPKSAPPPIQQADPWGGGSTSQPSSQSQSPWGSPAISSSAPVSSTSFDAFGNSSQPAANDLDGFDLLGSRSTGGSGDLLGGGGVSLQNNSGGVGAFNMMGLDQGLPMQQGSKKTPETFLGENSSLVNLDNLISAPAAPPPQLPPPVQPAGTNPFLGIAPPPQPVAQPAPAKPVSNPFQAQMVRPPTINQMRSPPGPPAQPGLVGLGGTDGLPQPLLPMGNTAQPAQPTNPFL